MLNTTNMIITINDQVIGYIKELNMLCSSSNLIVLAEVVTFDPHMKTESTNYYMVENINTVRKKTYVSLIELDTSPSISSSEKIIDIREFRERMKKVVKST